MRLPDAESIAREAARLWLEIARDAVSQRGSFSIALSGGATPRRLYELMASAPANAEAPWSQTFVFWGDERRVAPGHDDSNYRLAKDALLDRVPVPSNQIFPMQGLGLAGSATRDYDSKLLKHFGLQTGEWPRFDLILLGMGSDGHIASIFPGTRAASDLTNMVVVFEVPQLRKERMTVTRPVLGHARNLIFLVSGSEKAHALAMTLEGTHQPSTYPAQGIKPLPDTRVMWLVDYSAAAQLTQS